MSLKPEVRYEDSGGFLRVPVTLSEHDDGTVTKRYHLHIPYDDPKIEALYRERYPRWREITPAPDGLIKRAPRNPPS